MPEPVCSLLDETETKYVSEYSKQRLKHGKKLSENKEKSKMVIYSNFEELMKQAKLKSVEQPPLDVTQTSFLEMDNSLNESKLKLS